MTYNPFNNVEIEDGAPADEAFFGKVKGNFENHEMRLVNEELDVDLVRAIQIVIDDVPGIYTALNIEDALMEVMALSTLRDANQTTALSSNVLALSGRMDGMDTLSNIRHSNHTDILISHASRLTDVEGRATVLEAANTAMGIRVTNDEARILENEADILALENRKPQADRESALLSFLGCASINKADFITQLVPSTGIAPLYNANALNQTGVGAIESTQAAVILTYSKFIPINILLGVGAFAAIKAPLGTSVTYGLNCYTSTQETNGIVYVASGLAANAAFQSVQTHFKDSGIATDNFPAGTRFVKPFIQWTGNTGTVTIDFMGVFPMLYSQYTIF